MSSQQQSAKADEPATHNALPGEQIQEKSSVQPEPSQQNTPTENDGAKKPETATPEVKGDSNEKNEDTKDKDDDKSKSKQPPGGYDSTPIPHAEPGYTVKFTFHRAENLPFSDINSISSDPYLLAQLNTGLKARHKEDPYLRLRSPTVRRNCNPEWNCEWIVANVPASGFKLKVRVYDEDPADHDDRLGNVHVTVPGVNEAWEGLHNECYKIRKRVGSKRAYLFRYVAFCIGQTKHMNGRIYISAEVLGRTQDEEGGRCYTVGPCWWTKHYSPLLGRIANRKDTENENQANPGHCKSQRYNFQATQMQLAGPVPAELYHRYVEFRPVIKSGFTNKGIKGFLFNKTLHHQHARVYNFDRSTEHGVFEKDNEDVTRKFLELCHYDRGGRIYTYVLTLDALFRFTETGKEFGIDMLSKHTMHSDVSIYIAFSGEFFIRRLKRHNAPSIEEGGENSTQPSAETSNGLFGEDVEKDIGHYQLVIDNDSGTYRPNAKLLPKLKEFFEHSFPGLQVMTLDSQGDAEKMSKMKEHQRERKAREGNNLIFTQADYSSSDSSSDEEALDAVERANRPSDRGLLKNTTKDLSRKATKKKSKLMTDYRLEKNKRKEAEAQHSASAANV